MTETQTHEPETQKPLTTDLRLLATVLTPLAMAGAVIAALREAH